VPSIWFWATSWWMALWLGRSPQRPQYRHVVDRTFAAIMALYALSAAYYLALPLYFVSLESPDRYPLARAAMLVAFGTFC
jgi:hypothetical protein